MQVATSRLSYWKKRTLFIKRKKLELLPADAGAKIQYM